MKTPTRYLLVTTAMAVLATSPAISANMAGNAAGATRLAQATTEEVKPDADAKAKARAEAKAKKQAERAAAKAQAKAQAQAQDGQPPEQAAEPAAEAQPKPKKKQMNQAAEQPPAPPQPAEQAAEPVKKPKKQQAAEEPQRKKKPQQAAEEPAAEPKKQQAAEQPAAPQATQEQPAQAAEEPAPRPKKKQAAEEPAATQGEQPAQAAEEPQRKPRKDRQQAEQPAAAQNGSQQAENPLPENAAPALDSAKTGDQPTAKERQAGDKQRKPRDQRQQQQAEQPAAPPPKSDAAAQAERRPAKIESATAEKGRRIDRRPERRHDNDDEVVGKFGDRVVIRFGNGRIGVETRDERPRWAHDARDYYVEELPRGRTREVAVRRDGTQIVTIRNRYGDVIRRSRIEPNGREIVLVYVDERHWDRPREYYDPGRDLPPLRLTVPVNEYILDGRRADRRDYHRFLEKPPIATIDRYYSVDDVKRSARLRDTMPRIDLDMITFEFGSAEVGEDQIPLLEELANAMLETLDENPAETFLIEGHTDAVGSDYANLALSDARAEAVAAALTNVFGLPPENLVTQGYGEAYLKVQTEAPERANRRVAVRRITPLIAPVASAQ
ncbi:MAG: OmpA family protein [Flavobacteriaceae bacterium]